jgi:tRNA threonylcarbamoyladenosine biosynthesis protein TsaB
MRILALDTATELCSAALWIDGACTSEEIKLDRGHGERVLVMIDGLLSRARLALRDLDAIAVGRGPGGFTGVRLAIGVAQGLALGAERPVVGVSDLAAVAQAIFDREPQAMRVLVCNDARMREVYCGLFERGPQGMAMAVGDEAVLQPDAVPEPPPSTWGAGRGFRAYPALRERFANRLAGLDDVALPHARDVARLGAAAASRGEGLPPERLLPVYLRDRVAEPPSSR